MKPPTKIFIHTNDKQSIGATVSKYSILKHCSFDVEVQIINLKEYPQLLACDGCSYRRGGTLQHWKKDDLQSFTLLRFLPPELMRYQGRALVIDPDVFAVSDIAELLAMNMRGKSIWARPKFSSHGDINGFYSSVMLLDCGALRHWKFESIIKQLFSNEIDYKDVIELRHENFQTIGLLEPCWNDFDTLTAETKLLHNTNRRTQPWKSGLRVDFEIHTKNPPSGYKWGVIPRSFIAKAKEVKKGLTMYRYERHPDRGQERLFYSLLSECIKHSFVSKDEIKAAIDKKYIRKDSFDILRNV